MLKKYLLIVGLILLLAKPALAANISLLYGHNGTSWVPLLTSADGTLKTDMDLTDHDSDIIPAADNLYNIGSSTLRWLSGNFMSMRVFGNTNISGLCVAENSMISMADGTKKRITDVKEGDYVLSLDEETGKIVSNEVKALLDMGIKPVFNLTTKSGKSIKTTGNHPYLTKEGWIKVSELNAGDKIAVPMYQFMPNSFLMSSVESTFTLPCCLCLFSSDQSSYSAEDNARAKYGASLVCSGSIFNASGRNSKYSEDGMTSIFLNNTPITACNSAFVSPENSAILSSLLFISPTIYSGEQSSTPLLESRLIKESMNPRFINAWNTMFASTINFMPENQEDMPCLLAIPNFTSSASLKACSFVSLLLDTMLSAKENSTSSMNSCTTLFKAISNSPFNSGGISTLKTTSAIFESPSKAGDYNYLNLVDYDEIASIEYSGDEHVYDLMIEGTHNFIANDIIAHNTYINNTLNIVNGNVGIGTTSPTSTLHVVGNANITGTIYAHNYSGNSDIVFMNSTGDVKMVIKDDGNVGIGTTSPAAKLHINGSATPALAIQNLDGYPHLHLLNSSGSYHLAMFISSVDGKTAGIFGGGNDVWLGSNANGNNPSGSYVYLKNSNGNVGIGDTDPSEATLSVQGGTICDADGSLGTCASDIRLKENIKPVENAVAYLTAFKPVEFNFIGESEKLTGLIAQEVQEAYPDLIFKTGEEDYITYKDPGFKYILIKAVQEQQSQIREQQSHLSLLQSENTALKKLICLDHPGADICQ